MWPAGMITVRWSAIVDGGMAKLQVFDDRDSDPVPFLRGILTRSLQDAGLDFDQAYSLASVIRDELGDREDDGETTTEVIHKRVVKHLRKDFGEQIAERYEHLRARHPNLTVICPEGQASAFSRSQLGRCLQSSGIGAEQVGSIANAIYQHYVDRGQTEVRSRALKELTARYLRRSLGAEVESRYRLWLQFANSGRPLLLLIGGTSGCGKSTIASELAGHLDIVRTQSTDMLREVMRMMVPQRLIPVLHTSSFGAWQVLPRQGGIAQDFDAMVADGYRAQAEHVSVACEAVIRRAANERVSLILEGVHVGSELLQLVPPEADMTVVLVMLGVLDPEALQARFKGRGEEARKRGAHRYLENFDAVWSLQSTLLSEADVAGISVISNDDKQVAAQQILTIILDAVAREQQVLRVAGE